jgi:hypothetical protein
MFTFSDIFKTILNPRYSVSSQTVDIIRKEWKNIDTLVKHKGPSQLRQALISADKTLDNALRDIASGETFAERIKSIRNRFSPHVYNQIWEAHLVRNNLVHEAGFEPPHFILTESVAKIRKGLKEIGVNI